MTQREWRRHTCVWEANSASELQAHAQWLRTFLHMANGAPKSEYPSVTRQRPRDRPKRRQDASTSTPSLAARFVQLRWPLQPPKHLSLCVRLCVSANASTLRVHRTARRSSIAPPQVLVRSVADPTAYAALSSPHLCALRPALCLPDNYGWLTAFGVCACSARFVKLHTPPPCRLRPALRPSAEQETTPSGTARSALSSIPCALTSITARTAVFAYAFICFCRISAASAWPNTTCPSIARSAPAIGEATEHCSSFKRSCPRAEPHFRSWQHSGQDRRFFAQHIRERRTSHPTPVLA